MGLGGVAIAVLPSMIYPKQPFSDGLGGVYKKKKAMTFTGYRSKSSIGISFH